MNEVPTENRPVETCDECRFDASAFTHDDILGTLRALVPWWTLVTRFPPGDALTRRPDPATWSALEYCTHTASILALHAVGIAMLTDANVAIPDFPPEAPIDPTAAVGDIAVAIRSLDDAAQQLRDAYGDAHKAGHRNTLTVGDGVPFTTDDLVRHALHDALHHLQDVGRGFAILGAGTPSQTGRVERVSAGRGLPKPALDGAAIGFRGVEGDVQRERRHHGRVWQALCIASADSIERLQHEGHPIAPGAAGENLTLRGIDFEQLRPGTRIAIADVIVELSVPALPCAKNAQWFVGGDFMRMHHDRDWSATRWYARVLHDGHVRPGDRVVVEP